MRTTIQQPSFRFRCDRTFGAPSSLDSRSNRLSIQHGFLRPCRKTLGSIKGCNYEVYLSVAILFCSRRPSDVAFFVMSVVVDAIQRMFFGRTFPNLKEKLFKGIKSKLDTTSAVSRIIFDGWIVTAGTSAIKNDVFGSSRSAINQISFWSLAPTRFVSFNLIARQDAQASAFTLTKPCGVSSWVRTRISKNVKHAESLVTKVFNSRIKVWCDRMISKHLLKISPLMNVSRVARGSSLSQPAFSIA